MVKLLVTHLFLVLTIIFTVSALRESRFCEKLKKNYNLEFIQKLQVNQIHRRVNDITRIKIQYNLTADGVTFANASIRSFRFLHDLLDNSTSPSSRLNISSHYYSALYKKYEGLVRKFHRNFIAEYPQIISIDYEDPESLWVKLNSLDNPGNSTETFESIRKKALLLVDAYKEDIDYIKDHYASTAPNVLTPKTISKEKCERYGGSCRLQSEIIMELAPIPTENQIKLAKFCSNSLASLRDEIEIIQKTGSLSIPALDILLQRFISITELITMKADTAL